MTEWGTNAGSTFDDHYRLVAGGLLWRHELAAILDGAERARVAVVDQTTEGRLLTVVISLTVRGTEDERAVFAEYVRAAADASRVQAIGGGA